MKTAYLYNFTKYTEWPFHEKLSIFEFCIYEDEELYSAVQQIEGKKVFGATIVTRHIHSAVEKIENCKLVYFGESAINQSSEIKSRIDDLPILTISSVRDIESMIHFSVIGNRLRFVINQSKMRAQGLNMNARILALAYKVEE